MKVYRGFRYRLSPTEEQIQKFLQFGGNTRFVWNTFARMNQDSYEKTQKFIFRFDLQNSLPALKEQFPFLKDSYAQNLTCVALNFGNSLNEFIKKRKGFPKFKKKDTMNDSFTYPQGWALYPNTLYLPKIGYVRFVKHRPMAGKPKSVTVSQEGQQWYCSVLCEQEIAEQGINSDNPVGIDVGIKEFATLSDGTVINNPRITKKYEQKLAREQRRLSRKVKGSKNRFKQRMKVRKVHAKIKNTRTDFIHKTSTTIAEKYDSVVMENLNVKDMLQDKKLAKSISDVSWYSFGNTLEYKCKRRFKGFTKIDKYAPSSKTCSGCGHVKDMPLNKRTYDCPECGLSIDRDLNASINIKNFSLQNTDGQSGINACGDGGLLPSVKQEKECLDN